MVACTFALPVKVNCLAMSANASAHCLIAVGGGDRPVRLCDPGSGAVTQSLVGHADAVWSVHWSLSNDWHVATGGQNGQVGAHRGPEFE